MNFLELGLPLGRGNHVMPFALSIKFATLQSEMQALPVYTLQTSLPTDGAFCLQFIHHASQAVGFCNDLQS